MTHRTFLVAIAGLVSLAFAPDARSSLPERNERVNDHVLVFVDGWTGLQPADAQDILGELATGTKHLVSSDRSGSLAVPTQGATSTIRIRQTQTLRHGAPGQPLSAPTSATGGVTVSHTIDSVAADGSYQVSVAPIAVGMSSGTSAQAQAWSSFFQPTSFELDVDVDPLGNGGSSVPPVGTLQFGHGLQSTDTRLVGLQVLARHLAQAGVAPGTEAVGDSFSVTSDWSFEGIDFILSETYVVTHQNPISVTFARTATLQLASPTGLGADHPLLPIAQPTALVAAAGSSTSTLRVNRQSFAVSGSMDLELTLTTRSPGSTTPDLIVEFEQSTDVDRR